MGSLDDESLLGMSGDEKSRTGTPLGNTTPQEILTPTHGDLDTGLEPLPSDSRSVINDSSVSEPAAKKTAYEHSLSEDLLLGDEHFKASYTDDDDDDDNITVTVSNPASMKSGDDVDIKKTFSTGDEDLANLDSGALDYTEDGGSWT